MDSSGSSTAKGFNENVYPPDFWLPILRGIKRWKPHALPESLNMDDKHVWGPPVFAYNHLIGEEYEKKREAVLKYTKDDRARTTEILDIDVEYDLLYTYLGWAEDNVLDGRDSGDSERASFFAGLYKEVRFDCDVLADEYYRLGVTQKRLDDGTWKIMSRSKYLLPGGRWSDEESSADGIASKTPSIEADKTDSEDEEESHSNNRRIFTATTDDEELNWLSSIDPEAYAPMPRDDEGDTDNDASPTSSDSDAYADARSTLSEHDSDQDDEEGREAKRRRLDFWNVVGVSKH